MKRIKVKILLFLILTIIIVGCIPRDKDKKVDVDIEVKVDTLYFKNIRLDNELDIKGAVKLSDLEIESNDYFMFIYQNNILSKVISKNSLSASYHELNKYFFDVPQSWSSIEITYSAFQKSYLFKGDKDLILFQLDYNDSRLLQKVIVYPYSINYDFFSRLGTIKPYVGVIKLDEKCRVSSVKWLGSSLEYFYSYNRDLMINKQIRDRDEILYRIDYSYYSNGLINEIK